MAGPNVSFIWRFHCTCIVFEFILISFSVKDDVIQTVEDVTRPCDPLSPDLSDNHRRRSLSWSSVSDIERVHGGVQDQENESSWKPIVEQLQTLVRVVIRLIIVESIKIISQIQSFKLCALDSHYTDLNIALHVHVNL